MNESNMVGRQKNSVTNMPIIFIAFKHAYRNEMYDVTNIILTVTTRKLIDVVNVSRFKIEMLIMHASVPVSSKHFSFPTWMLKIKCINYFCKLNVP